MKNKELMEQLKETEKNDEKTNTPKTKWYQNLLTNIMTNEGNNEEILKLEFNHFKEDLNKIMSTIKTKEKNPEEAMDLIIIKNLFDKITEIVPKIQNQIEKKCSLIYSNLCSYESSEGEIINNEEDSIKKVQLNCGHYFHYECLRSDIAIYSNCIEEEIIPNTEVKCPICFKYVIVL
ncbi:hypothetical protein H8356DRAFT_1694797 [Neocallimastix lanati (nom. inval.)]|nr:hypothetical protein H8356DRAFT_1694797 [Neocallimastix sp. JGI-2020a]